MSGFRGVSAAVLLGCCVGSAAAQDRVITFGDSLSDNGNLFATTGQPPAPYNRRFTNGITWTEILAGGSQNSPFQGTGVTGDVNLAFGGARTDGALNLNGPVPSVPTQIGTFFAFGGSIGASDVVTLQGGANNIFQYFTTAGLGATQAGISATSVAAANDLSSSAGQLVATGARTILISNLPNIGNSPQFSGSAATAQGGSLATDVFNDQLAANVRLLAAANPGTNFIQMDWAGLFRAVTANAAAFGFTNTTQACIAVVNCVTGSTATQNTFLFWDGVHPTGAAHAIIAQYAAILLSPETTAAHAAPQAEVAIRARQNAGDDVFDRTAGWARGQFGQQNGFYATVIGTYGEADAHGRTPDYRYQLGGVRTGLDRAFGNVLVGGSVGISTGEIGGGALTSDVGAYDADVYASALNGPFYVAAHGGLSYLTFDSSRSVGLGPIEATGSTRGLQGSVSGEVGVLAKLGAVTVMPSARIGYVRSHVSGYSESGDILAMEFDDRTIDAAFTSGRVRASAPLSLGIVGTTFVEVGYEWLLSSSGNSVNARFVNNTANAFSTEVGEPLARGFNAKIGVDGTIGTNSAIALSYGVAVPEAGGIVHSGVGQIKVPF